MRLGGNPLTLILRFAPSANGTTQLWILPLTIPILHISQNFGWLQQYPTGQTPFLTFTFPIHETLWNTTAEDAVGLTEIMFYESSGTMLNSTVTLAATDRSGYVLSEADVQNVALHELGHSMGLGHSGNYSDVMYLKYTLGSPIRALSTLDLYGVATVFQWMANSTEFTSAGKLRKTSSVTLPTDIKFQYLPISSENLPPQSPLDSLFSVSQSFLTYILQFILSPEFLILSLSAAFALLVVIILFIVRRRREKQQIQTQLAPPKRFPTTSTWHRGL